MPTVVIPALLRKFTGGAARVEVPGRSIRELVRHLGEQFPGIDKQLLEDGDIRPSIAVSIDGEIATGGVLDPVGENSEVHFIPALGGGGV
jgi:molybdopterin synthase sulfur carrier subunit